MRKNLLSVIFLLASFAVYADGNDVIKKTLELPEFHSVSVNSSYTVYLKQTNKQEVSVEALKEYYDISEFKVKDGVLHININKKEDNASKSLWAKIDDIKLAPTLKVYISMKNVKKLSVNGSGKIISENSIASPEIDLLVSGAGSIDLDLKGSVINSEISGSGNIKIKGYASDHKILLTGSGIMNAYDFEVERANAHLSGSGNCEINVSDALEARIHGTGLLQHKGNTKSVTSEIFGQGTVKRTH
ncbi:MAG: head GIN domain-containing protein [Candidatus Cyclobacteriaceae bacterium M2_1C_046]